MYLDFTVYCILVWDNTYKTHVDKILKLQKWALRTISREHYRCHTDPLFIKHNILKVSDTFKLELGVFMYKHQTNSLPRIFCNYFTKNSQIYNYGTRNASGYSAHKRNKMFSDRAIRAAGPTLWNSLDNKFKIRKSSKHIRNMYKSNLIACYSLLVFIFVSL